MFFFTLVSLALFSSLRSDESLFATGYVNFNFNRLQRNITIRNERMLTKIPSLSNVSTEFDIYDCNGKIVADGPAGSIIFSHSGMDRDVEKRCTWVIEAPEHDHAFVYNVRYMSDRHLNDDVDWQEYHNIYHKAPRLTIYDGPRVLESSSLFRLGDPSLEKAISSGRDMTIDIKFGKLSNESDWQHLLLDFAFVKSSMFRAKLMTLVDFFKNLNAYLSSMSCYNLNDLNEDLINAKELKNLLGLIRNTNFLELTEFNDLVTSENLMFLKEQIDTLVYLINQTSSHINLKNLQNLVDNYKNLINSRLAVINSIDLIASEKIIDSTSLDINSSNDSSQTSGTSGMAIIVKSFSVKKLLRLTNYKNFKNLTDLCKLVMESSIDLKKFNLTTDIHVNSKSLKRFVDSHPNSQNLTNLVNLCSLVVLNSSQNAIFTKRFKNRKNLIHLIDSTSPADLDFTIFVKPTYRFPKPFDLSKLISLDEKNHESSMDLIFTRTNSDNNNEYSINLINLTNSSYLISSTNLKNSTDLAYLLKRINPSTLSMFSNIVSFKNLKSLSSSIKSLTNLTNFINLMYATNLNNLVNLKNVTNPRNFMNLMVINLFNLMNSTQEGTDNLSSSRADYMLLNSTSLTNSSKLTQLHVELNVQ